MLPAVLQEAEKIITDTLLITLQERNLRCGFKIFPIINTFLIISG